MKDEEFDGIGDPLEGSKRNRKSQPAGDEGVMPFGMESAALGRLAIVGKLGVIGLLLAALAAVLLFR